MIKRFLSAIVPVAFCACAAFGQQVSLGAIEQLPLPEGSFRPTLSPDGATLLFSTQDGTTLKAFDMDNGHIQTIEESAAAGIEPVFTSDSKHVIYQTVKVIDKLTYRDVREADLYTGKSVVTEKMSRNRLSMKALPNRDYAVADYDRICLSKDGKLIELKPIADAYSYILATLSPDGKKILFIEPFKGLFVCDIDGNNLKNLAARVSDAAWAGNNDVVFTVSHDDGYIILTSALMYYNIADDSWTTLTDENLMPAEVTASGADKEIVFSTYSGEIYRARLLTEK